MSLSELKLYTEYSGAEFNKIYKDTKLYKFLNDDLKHYDFEYRHGLNGDTKQFNPTSTCSEGGLYFCEKSKCYLYWDHYGEKLAIIEIPDDARVYVEEDKFKTNKLVINKIMDFCDVDDDFWMDILMHPDSGYVLKYVKKQTYDICKSAVQQNGRALKYVEEEFKTDELCTIAVQQNYRALKYVTNQTSKICIIAVQQNRYAFNYVKQQFRTHEIRNLASKNNHNDLIMSTPIKMVSSGIPKLDTTSRFDIDRNNTKREYLNTPSTDIDTNFIKLLDNIDGIVDYLL